VAERPAPAVEAQADEPSSGTRATTSGDADAAWLAGVPLSEPPPDPDGAPEPPPEDVPAPWERNAGARAAESSPPAGPHVRETPRQAAERQVRESRMQPAAPSAADRTDDYDEPSADDPDIASTGLVGVPLVVQVLNGKVIDEVTEDPA
jgi:DNA polymerase-3 subunit gamma/tau